MFDPTNRPDPRTGKGLLAALYRRVLYDAQIGVHDWRQMIESYLSDPANGIEQTGEARHQATQELEERLRSIEMDADTFHLALRLLGALRYDLAAMVTWHDRTRQPTSSAVVGRF